MMKGKILIALSLMLFLHSLVLAQGGSWVPKASLPDTARFSAAAFSIGSKGYLSTGGQIMCQIKFNDLWEWDQEANIWSQKANLPGGKRFGATGFAIGTKGYIIFGADGDVFRDLWEWDQATNTWARKTDFPGTQRQNAVGFSIGEKAYVGTGFLYYGNDPYFHDFWQWDQASDTWTQMADFGGGNRNLAIGFAIGNKGYIGTGADSLTLFNDLWEWDEVTNIWTQKSSLPGVVRAAAVGFNLSNYGLVGSGSGYTSRLRDFWLYDPVSDSWESRTDMAAPRTNAAGFAIGKKGYVATGYGDGWLHDLWEFDSQLTGMNDLAPANKNSIFPNPTSTTINLHLPSTHTTITIFNLLGEKVREEKVSLPAGQAGGGEITMDVSELPAGLYFVRTEEAMVGKFVKLACR